MEYILISLFGGGTDDWKDISSTNYDWYDIFKRVRMDYGINHADINTLYAIILQLALEDLEEAMQNYDGEKSEEFIECSTNINKYFETFTNCLDTHLWFRGTEELGKEIQEKLEKEIEQINDDIGFTYISF